MLATTTLTTAAPNDYRFEAAEVEASGPGKTRVVVRLVHVPDKKPIDGAVILESKCLNQNRIGCTMLPPIS